MSTLAARQLQRSVIIIYLFRTLRGESESAEHNSELSGPAALCSVVQWHITMKITKVQNKLHRKAYGDVMLH